MNLNGIVVTGRAVFHIHVEMMVFIIVVAMIVS